MRKRIDKDISKILSGKQSQKCLDYTKKSATDRPKTASKRLIQRTAKQICHLIDQQIADKLTKSSTTSPLNSLEAVENEIENMEFDIEIPKEIYTSAEKKLLMT